MSALRQVIERNERISDLRDIALVRSHAGSRRRPSLTVIVGAPDLSDARRQARALRLPTSAELVMVASKTPGDPARQAAAVPGARVVLLSRDASLAERLAAGVDAAQGDVVVTCRRLVTVRAGWWEQLSQALACPHTGLVSGVLTPAHAPGVACLGLAFSDRMLNCRWVTGPVPVRDQTVPLASTTFAAVRREVLAAAGGIDTGLVGQGLEDVELSVRLWRLGLTCHLVPQVRVTADFSAPEVTNQRSFLLNVLRTAVIHLDGPDLADVIAALREDALLPDVLAEVALSNAGTRRAQIERLAEHDFSWFLKRFPPRGHEGGE